MNTDQTPTLATMLKERRASLGVTQEEAADAIGVSTRGYRFWESGQVEVPHPDHRRQIAQFLALPADQVMAVITNADLAETESRMIDIVRRVLREET